MDFRSCFESWWTFEATSVHFRLSFAARQKDFYLYIGFLYSLISRIEMLDGDIMLKIPLVLLTFMASVVVASLHLVSHTLSLDLSLH